MKNIFIEMRKGRKVSSSAGLIKRLFSRPLFKLNTADFNTYCDKSRTQLNNGLHQSHFHLYLKCLLLQTGGCIMGNVADAKCS